MKYLLIAFALVGAFDATAATTRKQRQMMREHIKSLPITERPNRFGHFYGRAVRREHYKSQGLDPRSIPTYRPVRGVYQKNR